jgi:hypothetical protein
VRNASFGVASARSSAAMAWLAPASGLALPLVPSTWWDERRSPDTASCNHGKMSRRGGTVGPGGAKTVPALGVAVTPHGG